MIAPTHMTFAGFIYLLLLTTTGVALSVVNAATVVVASILPDVDTGSSIVGRSIPFLSRWIERTFGHRTLTHSVPFIAGLAILLLPLLFVDKDIYFCVCIGYATHPFLDSMTINGVKLFYPFSGVRCVFPLEVNNPHRYRVQTGSRMDKTLGALFLLASIPTFLIAHQGYERFIRFAQGNIESAVRDYNEFSQTHHVHATINAHNLLTKERISGTFEIVGSLNDHTLLFRASDGQVNTLGKQYKADYVADKVVCQRGFPARTVVTSIDMANQPLSQLALYLDSRNDNHFFGVLTSSDEFTLPQESREFMPVTGTAGTLRFHFASYDDIRRYNLEDIYITKGILTVRAVIDDIPSVASLADDSAHGMPTLPASFSSVSFELDARETVEFVRSRGDTVNPGDLLARKNSVAFYGSEIDLNNKKLESLRNETETRLGRLEQRIREKRERIINDSLKALRAAELSTRGFMAGVNVEKAAKALQLHRDDLEVLLAESRSIVEKASLQMEKLANQNRQLEVRLELSEHQSLVTSNVSGVIVDIRQFSVRGTTRMSFIIRHMAGE